jgi:hypothetical protein
MTEQQDAIGTKRGSVSFVAQKTASQEAIIETAFQEAIEDKVLPRLKRLEEILQSIDEPLRRIEQREAALDASSRKHPIASRQGNSNATPAFEEPRARDEDVTKTGAPRKKRKGISSTQQQNMSLDEILKSVPESHHHYYKMAPNGEFIFTLKEYWTQYKYGSRNLPPLMEAEVETKGKWRCQRLSNDGGRCCQTYNFFNVRKDMYNLVHYYIDHQGMTEEAAIKESSKIFELVPVSKRTRRPPQKGVCKAFQTEMDRLEDLAGSCIRRYKKSKK